MVKTLDTQLPGVGIYSPVADITKRAAPGHTLGKRFEAQKRFSSSPGPAAYQPQNLSVRRAVSIPKERRHASGKKNPKRFGSSQINLGPGQYKLESIFEQQKKRKGHKFGKGENRRSPKFVELHEKERHNNPGPGTYSQTPIYSKKMTVSQKRLTDMPRNASMSKLQMLGGS